eukprot:m.708418 g.708418  ORF g.708418 m.708418 type:complete len:1023 (-) comp22938_c1_seq8:248-3316(-)
MKSNRNFASNVSVSLGRHLVLVASLMLTVFVAFFQCGVNATSPGGFPNSLGRTPPRGWRSWGAWTGDVDATKMVDAARGLAKKRPLGPGHKMVSLFDMGYKDVGLDSGWQVCGAGVNGSYHNATTHHVIVDTTAFPDLGAMNHAIHQFNVTSSWYLNCDGCESKCHLSEQFYTPDANDAVRFDFDGVKFDTQVGGPDGNITMWAEALNHTGKPMMIENCLDKHPAYLLTDPVHCPFNFYRSGPDNGPSFFGGMWNLHYWTTPFLNVTEPVPASRPGCWAYMDMLSIGAPIRGSAAKNATMSHGCADMTLTEEASLFASWAIVSSPLILTFDVSNDTEVERLWPIVGNPLALSINAQFAGEAGRLLKQSGETDTFAVRYGATCEAVAPSITVPRWSIWTKRLEEPKHAMAVLVLNLQNASNLTLSVSYAELTAAAGAADGAVGGTGYTVRSVWSGQQEQGVVVNKATPWVVKSVPPHGNVFVVLEPTTRVHAPADVSAKAVPPPLRQAPWVHLEGTGASWEVAEDHYHACDGTPHQTDGADSMPIAWYNRRDNESYWVAAVSRGIRPNVHPGPTIEHAMHDCSAVVFNSTFSANPSTYANFQWLQSVRVFSNGTGFALVHNEWHGELFVPQWCSLNASQHDNLCQMWSTGLAVTHDGGRTFALARKPPQHLVAALPHQYTNDQQLAGYGAVSPMFKGGDGAYYGIINIAGYDPVQKGGNCAFRTDAPFDPTSYRGWNGTHFSVVWHNPYTSASTTRLHGMAQPRSICQVFVTNTTTPFSEHVCFRRMVWSATDRSNANGALPTYVAIGTTTGNIDTIRYAYSWEEDFAVAITGEWSPPQTLFLDATVWMGKRAALYPVMLDVNAPIVGAGTGDADIMEDGDNYALVSNGSTYVYFVAGGRDVIRRKLTFSLRGPQPPPIPPAPLPEACTVIQVINAGNASANGVYTRLDNVSGAMYMFQKDASAQIYGPINDCWHLGHIDVGPVVYQAPFVNTSRVPPSSGWIGSGEGGKFPTPTFACMRVSL